MEGLNFEIKKPEAAEQAPTVENRAGKIRAAEQEVKSLFDNRATLEKIVSHLQDKPVFGGPEERN